MCFFVRNIGLRTESCCLFRVYSWGLPVNYFDNFALSRRFYQNGSWLFIFVILLNSHNRRLFPLMLFRLSPYLSHQDWSIIIYWRHIWHSLVCHRNYITLTQIIIHEVIGLCHSHLTHVHHLKHWLIVCLCHLDWLIILLRSIDCITEDSHSLHIHCTHSS